MPPWGSGPMVPNGGELRTTDQGRSEATKLNISPAASLQPLFSKSTGVAFPDDLKSYISYLLLSFFIILLPSTRLGHP